MKTIGIGLGNYFNFLYYKNMTETLFFLLAGAYAEWAPIILRVGLGSVFLIHGWPKLKSPRNFAGFLSTLNIKPAMFWALVVAVVEFFGGIALIIGFLVPVAAFLIAVNMLVAIIKVRRKFVGGWEFDFVLLVMAVALILFG